MTRSRYTIEESWNRILRKLEGKPVTSDIPGGITGEVLTLQEAVSDLAELFEGSLPGETLVLPSSGLDYATTAEMYNGVLNDVVVTPSSSNAKDVYTEIWTWTGTATLTGYSSAAFAKITGSFHNSQTGYGITPQPSSDNILIGSGVYGNFLIDWHISFRGSSAILYSVEPYAGGVGVPQAVDRVKPSASGSAISMGGHGYSYISGTATLVDLRLLPDATAWMIIESAQLTVERMGK